MGELFISVAAFTISFLFQWSPDKFSNSLEFFLIKHLFTMLNYKQIYVSSNLQIKYRIFLIFLLTKHFFTMLNYKQLCSIIKFTNKIRYKSKLVAVIKVKLWRASNESLCVWYLLKGILYFEPRVLGVRGSR